MYLLYSMLLLILGILLLPVYLCRAVRRRALFDGLAERLGRLPESLKSDGRKTVWFHACSVGEALSLPPLAAALRERFPETRFVFSTITRTGQAVAAERFSDYGSGNTFYFPVDFTGIVRKVLDWIRPSLIIVVDTEIWPNLLRQARAGDIPVVLVNGRISDDSFRYYRHGRFFLKHVLSRYAALLMQSEDDAARIARMGAPAGKIAVTGNLKFDAETITGKSADASPGDLERVLGTGFPEAPLIVAGSTHPGEEEILLDALDLVRRAPGLERTRLLVAPRHPERFDSVERLAAGMGFKVVRRTAVAGGSGAPDGEVLLLDTIGELASAYGLSTVAFVGGSLVRHGGHSILEPAAFSKPIVVGPFTDNFRAIVREFLRHGGIRQVAAGAEDRAGQARQLADIFIRLLGDPAERGALGAAALAILERNRGAVQRTVHCIEEFC